MKRDEQQLFNPEAIFERVKSSATEAIKDYFPIVGKNKQLVLNNIYVNDDKDPSNFAEQEQTKLNGGTWGVPIYGDLDLIDKNTGQIVDSTKKMKLMTLPKITSHRFSYIVNGNEYQVINQLRLKPGIYHRVKANEEIEAQINSARGRNFKIPFNRDTGVFHLKVGTANIKIYPVLRDLGVSDDQIIKHWGPDILRANQQASAGVAETESQKLYKNLFYHEKAVDKPTAVEGVRNYLQTMTEFDPEVMHYQVGHRHERLDPEVILKSTQKLLKISQGEEEPDDRDSVVVKKLLSVDDFLKEKLHLTKTKNPIYNKAVFNVDKKDKIREIIKHEELNRPIESFFTQSMLSNAEQQINPLHMMSMVHKLTFHGEGGIQSEQAVTNEARGVHPSHLGFIDPCQTPEGHNIGAVLHATMGLFKDGTELKTKVINAKTNKIEYINPKKFYDSKTAFPDEYDKKGTLTPRGKSVRIIHEGKFSEVDPKDVDYVIVNSQMMFSMSTNMIPFLPATSGNRALTTAKMAEQALPLVYREAPLTQVKMDDKSSYEKNLGGLYSFKSPVTGVVSDITNGVVTIRHGGKLTKVNTYDNFPLNSKHFLHTDLKVKPGDTVQEGQLLGDSNYTQNGVLALGTNLRTAYIPWHGYNYEDGVVVSQSGAKKLSSMHMHKESVMIDENAKLDKNMFRAHYPSYAKEDLYKKLDDTGLIKVGQIVQPGDMLASVLKKATPSIEDEVIKNIHKSLIHPWKNNALHWDHDTPGEVVKIGKHGKRLDIYIKTVEPAVVGDKIAGRHGNKGIVTKILPDNEMPHTEDGQPVHILLNPQGIPSRMNLGTVLETSVSKAARTRGKPYIVENFIPVNYTNEVKKELAATGHHTSGAETLIDPEDSKELGKVLVGEQFIMKLDHAVSKKFNTRTTGQYTSEGIPTRGSDEGGQSADPLFLYSMLAHGAKENLFDMATIKAERNDEFWRAMQTGRPTPPPKPTFVFDKFLGMLKAMGVDVQKKGNRLVLNPLTDAQTLQQSSGAIRNAKGLRAKDLMEEEGGLFDKHLTGGLGGSKWSHIDLAEPFPNPLFEDAIKTVTGLNEKVYLGIIDGTHSVTKDGEVKEGLVKDALTGGAAIKALLGKIDVNKRLDQIESDAVNAPPQKLNKLNKEIRFLRALKTRGLTPDVYMMTKLPVLPPKYRPVIVMPSGDLNASDLNLLYKDTLLNNEKMAEAKGILPEEDIAKLRTGVYQYIGGLYGLSDAPSYRKYKGILDMIRGTSQAKEGMFQAKLVARRQDLTARSTVVVEPNYGPDEVGLPREMAKALYKPFVIKRLVGLGLSPLKAEEELEKESSIAVTAMQQELTNRPILLNRAPSLHKFNVVALKPKLVDGHAIKVPPLITVGLNMDFDGDCVWTLVQIAIDNSKLSGISLGNQVCTLEKELEMFKNLKVQNTTNLLIDIKDFPRDTATRIQKSDTVVEYDVPAGISVPAYINNKIALMPVTKFSEHENCEEVVVETKLGSLLLVSKDHSLYTVNPSTLVVEKSTPEESIGRCSPVSLGIKTGSLSTVVFTSADTSMGREIYKKEFTTDFDFGWFMGVMIGDGWATNTQTKHAVCLAVDKKESAVLAKWQSFLAKVSSHKAYIKDNPHTFDGSVCNSTKGTVSFKDLALWVGSQIGSGAHNKHLPIWVLNTPIAFRQGLMCGLLDTDGTINWAQRSGKAKENLVANYCTVSRELAEGVKVLSQSVGIKASITIQSHNSAPVYYISFSAITIKNNLSWLKLESAHKQAALTKVASTDFNASTTDIVPCPTIIKDLVSKLISKNTRATCKVNSDKAAFSVYGVVRASSGYITRFTAKACKNLIPTIEWETLPEVWRNWVDDTTIGWDVITKATVTGNRITMYDITVPDAWTFATGDGLIVQDTASIHIPVTEKAREESCKLLPSNNIENPGTGKIMLFPRQEAILGLYGLTAEGKKVAKSYTDVNDAVKDVKAGKLLATDIVDINGLKTSVGRYMVNQVLPEQYRDYNTQFKAKSLTKILSQLSHTHRNDFGNIVNTLKDLGNLHATKSGVTLNLDDIGVHEKERDAIIKSADLEVNKVKSMGYSPEIAHRKVVEIYNRATDKIDEFLKKLPVANNGLLQSVDSGARGDWVQVRQILMSPMLLKGSDGEVIPTPVRHGYAEGLNTSDYFIQSFGARSGAIDKSKQTSVPGYFSKRLINTAMDQTVTAIDDPDDPGVDMDINQHELRDRFLAQNIPGVASRGDLLDEHVLAMLKKKGIDTVKVMSPLTSTLPHGVAAKSFGLMPDGNLPKLGDNLGVISAQAMSEPSTQLSMKCQDRHSCVLIKTPTGEELYLTHEELYGLISTVEAVDGGVFEKYPSGYKVMDINGWASIHSISKHLPEVPMVFIKTAGGFGHVVQKDHPMFVVKDLWKCKNCDNTEYSYAGSSRNLRTIECKSCDVTEQMALIKFKEIHSVIKPAGMLSDSDKIVLDIRNFKLSESKMPEISNGYIAGAFVSEGSVQRKKLQRKIKKYKQLVAVIISQKEGAIRDRFFSRMTAYFGKEPRKEGVNLTIGSIEQAYLFYKNFGLHSEYKKLPGDFIHYPKDWLCDYVSGVVDGDGCIHDYHDGTISCNIVSTSRALLDQIQLLLSVFGVPSSIFHRKTTPTNKKARKRCLNLTFPVYEKTKQLFKESIKIQAAPVQQKVNKGKWLVDKITASKVTRVKEVEYQGYVYDIATSSEGYISCGMRTHNTFHLGGVAQGGVGSNLAAGMDRLLQLAELPEIVKGAGTLSYTDGKVEKIEDAPQGGKYIAINGVRHYAPSTRLIKVKVGDQVAKGDLITDGAIRPQELLELKGIEAVQQYLIDEFIKTYADQGVALRRPIVETVVRPLTNLSRVIDPGDLEDYAAGDYASTQLLMQKQRAGSSVQFKPVLKGINTLPSFSNDDWLAQLNFKDLKKVIVQGASKGWSSDIHGTSPISAWVYSAEFGRSKKPGHY